MTAPVRFPRFYVTSPAPCPYLVGQTERKVFTELKGPHAPQLNDALGPHRLPPQPDRCLPSRVAPGARHASPSAWWRASSSPSSTQKRILRNNSDLIVSECRPWATTEQFDLLQRYLGLRHPGGGMAAMDETDFADMVEHSPVSSFVIEYREPLEDGGSGRLVGACLTDRQGDGLSMIYSFYDPEHEGRSGLGNYIILDHIRRAAAEGLPYVYLGYWVEGSPRMQYKVRFRPLERLGPGGWRRFTDDEQAALIAASAAQRHNVGLEVDGSTKDGMPNGQLQYTLAETA